MSWLQPAACNRTETQRCAAPPYGFSSFADHELSRPEEYPAFPLEGENLRKYCEAHRVRAAHVAAGGIELSDVGAPAQRLMHVAPRLHVRL